MKNQKEIGILRERGACAEALKWLATQPSWPVAWATCPRGDWLEWCVVMFDLPFDWTVYRAAVAGPGAAYREAETKAWSAYQAEALRAQIPEAPELQQS